ncbi:MAG: hypothetical protein H7Z10_05450 [Gemmatimonadaceae bacterium]|nr:hypothetical protein [Acetobacteraceae bacterium]
MFNSTEDAMEAASDLKNADFGTGGRAGIQIVSGTEDDVDFEAMAKAGVPEDQAQNFAETIRNGGVLLIADAPFGTAARVCAILERSRSADDGVPEVTETRIRQAVEDDFGNATPLSTALLLPVLLKDPAPLSSYLNLPTLSKNQSPRPSAFGFPLLSKVAAPFSSLFKLPTLSDDPAPLSSLVKRPVLSSNATPLSSLVGWKVIWNDPTPLSSLLKLPVLSK